MTVEHEPRRRQVDGPVVRSQHNSAFVVLARPQETHSALPPPAQDLDWQQAEQVAADFLIGFEERTRKGYTSDLRQFARWCLAQGLLPLRVRRADLELYVRHMRDAGLARSTVARRCTALSGFFSYAVDEGLIDASPMTRVRRPKVHKDSSEAGLTKDETVTLLNAAAATNLRLHVLVAVLVHTGVRISEALGADVQDLGADGNHKTLRVVRKGGRRDVIALPASLFDLLRQLVADRTLGPLFITRSGRRWDRHAAWKQIHALSLRCFPDRVEPLHPHSLRAVNITLALAAGVPLHRVQQAAGHADPRMTMRYWRAAQDLDEHSNYTVAEYLNR